MTIIEYNELKANEEVGVKFMQRWEEEIILKQTAKEETRLDDLHNLMKNLGLSVEQAMEALGIPKEDYPKYMSLL